MASSESRTEQPVIGSPISFPASLGERINEAFASVQIESQTPEFNERLTVTKVLSDLEQLDVQSLIRFVEESVASNCKDKKGLADKLKADVYAKDWQSSEIMRNYESNLLSILKLCSRWTLFVRGGASQKEGYMTRPGAPAGDDELGYLNQDWDRLQQLFAAAVGTVRADALVKDVRKLKSNWNAWAYRQAVSKNYNIDRDRLAPLVQEDPSILLPPNVEEVARNKLIKLAKDDPQKFWDDEDVRPFLQACLDDVQQVTSVNPAFWQSHRPKLPRSTLVRDPLWQHVSDSTMFKGYASDRHQALTLRLVVERFSTGWRPALVVPKVLEPADADLTWLAGFAPDFSAENVNQDLCRVAQEWRNFGLHIGNLEAAQAWATSSSLGEVSSVADDLDKAVKSLLNAFDRMRIQVLLGVRSILARLLSESAVKFAERDFDFEYQAPSELLHVDGDDVEVVAIEEEARVPEEVGEEERFASDDEVDIEDEEAAEEKKSRRAMRGLRFLASETINTTRKGREEWAKETRAALDTLKAAVETAQRAEQPMRLTGSVQTYDVLEAALDRAAGDLISVEGFRSALQLLVANDAATVRASQLFDMQEAKRAFTRVKLQVASGLANKLFTEDNARHLLGIALIAAAASICSRRPLVWQLWASAELAWALEGFEQPSTSLSDSFAELDAAVESLCAFCVAGSTANWNLAGDLPVFGTVEDGQVVKYTARSTHPTWIVAFLKMQEGRDRFPGCDRPFLDALDAQRAFTDPERLSVHHFVARTGDRAIVNSVVDSIEEMPSTYMPCFSQAMRSPFSGRLFETMSYSVYIGHRTHKARRGKNYSLMSSMRKEGSTAASGISP